MSNLNEFSLDSLVNEKMEENLRDIQFYRNILIRIKNFEQFHSERNKIIQGMFNIEDDLRETYQIAKTTLTTNKNINEQMDEEIEKNKEITGRVISLENKLDEMQMDLRNVTGQLKYYKERDADNSSYIKELERRLLKLSSVNINSDLTERETDRENGRDPLSNNYYEMPKSHFSQSTNSQEEITNLPNEPTNNNIPANKIINERVNDKKMINDIIKETLEGKEIKKYDDKYEIGIQELPVKDYKKEDVKYGEDSKQSQLPAKQVSLASKANRVVDILMKLNSYDDINTIITKLFGTDLEQRLSSSDVDEELLNQVEDSIKEIEKLKLHDESKGAGEIKKKFLDTDTNDDIYESEKKTFPKNRANTEDYRDESPSWNGPGKKNNYESDKYLLNKRNTMYNRDNNNYTTYDSIINYLPKKSNYNSVKSNKELDYFDKRQEMKSSMRSTYSNSRHFSPPKKYENIDNSHSTICRSKSKTKNRNLLNENRNFNKILAGKIIGSNRNEEYNFENSLRSYLRKGVKRINKHNSNQIILRNHTTNFGNFFDPIIQKGVKSEMDTTIRTKSKSKPKVGKNTSSSYLM